MSWVTLLFVLGESTSVLAEGLLCHCGQGLLSCFSIRLFSNCTGELGVPLELQQVIQGFFRVAVGPPVILEWGRSSLEEQCRLAPVSLLHGDPL